MTNAAVATDGLQALEVTRDFPPEITFYHPLVVSDDVYDRVELLLIEVIGTHVGVQSNFLHDEIGPLGTNSVDVAERESDFLLRGDVDAKDTRHN